MRLCLYLGRSSSLRGGRGINPPQKEGYHIITLFNSKTLDGWHKNPERIGHGTGGAIVGEHDSPGSGNGGILLTDHKFGDFELLINNVECDIQINPVTIIIKLS
jgi:hypothetical protein